MSELSELFARDPVNLTDQDIDTIIRRLREAQTQFDLGVKPAAKAAKPKAGEKALKDLGLA